jgi:hypothetical protein
MKKWLALTCPVCGFRYPLTKFKPAMESIAYPVQIVTGGGRAKGFTVEEYLPWSTLPTLRQTNAWNSLLCLYDRLGAAYDHFYQVLGFLSPEVKKLLQELRGSYADAYRTNRFPDYVNAYTPTELPEDIVEPYSRDDYPDAYAHLLMNQISRRLADE